MYILPQKVASIFLFGKLSFVASSYYGSACIGAEK
jgi:hypothetical protein